MKALTAIAVLASLALLAATSAPAGARACGDAVVVDWTDGRIDGRYSPACYGEAVESLPEDLRAYSTATDDITRALRARIRESRDAGPAHGDSAPASDPALLGSPELSALAASVPLPLLLGGSIVLILAAAGLVRLVGRKIRRTGLHGGARPVGQW